jgi:hypothetical protein
MLHRSDRHVDVIRRATAIVADVPNEVAAETGDMIAAAEARPGRVRDRGRDGSCVRRACRARYGRLAARSSTRD